MNKTVASVIDDINEWNGPHGTVWFVTAMFTDESVGSVGKKDHDAALEVQGLLREAIGQELDFTLEASGQTKTGRDKFKILGFGTPGGAATYVAPGVQGGGERVRSGPGHATPSRSPEHDQFIQERMDRRTALMQAVAILAPAQAKDESGQVTQGLAVAVADWMYAWLRKTSEPASSDGLDPPGSPNAGVGSETTSPAADRAPTQSPGSTRTDAGGTGRPLVGDTQSAVSAADGGQVVDGEASACPPHDLDLDVAPKAMRYPCRKCGFWVKPTMAAEEAEEAAK